MVEKILKKLMTPQCKNDSATPDLGQVFFGPVEAVAEELFRRTLANNTAVVDALCTQITLPQALFKVAYCLGAGDALAGMGQKAIKLVGKG